MGNDELAIGKWRLNETFYYLISQVALDSGSERYNTMWQVSFDMIPPRVTLSDFIANLQFAIQHRHIFPLRDSLFSFEQVRKIHLRAVRHIVCPALVSEIASVVVRVAFLVCHSHRGMGAEDGGVDLHVHVQVQNQDQSPNLHPGLSS